MKITIRLKGAACVLFASFICVQGAVAEPAMWKVTDDDSAIWLFGSVHILDPETEWRTPLLNEVLQSVDVFYYETATDEKTEAAAQPYVLKMARNPEGRTLSSYLTDEQSELVAKIATRCGLSLEALQPFQPWFVSLTLTVLTVQAAGFEPASGVERVLSPETADDAERYFETPQEQIALFAGFSDEVQVNFLISGLETLEENPEPFKMLVDVWQAGDVRALNDFFISSLTIYPELYETLFLRRNLAWTDELSHFLEGDQSALIIVGAGHLVGKDGLPELLKSRGLNVERVQ